MKINKEVAQELFWEDNYDDYKYVESSPFESDGKWEHAYCVFQYKDTFYKFWVGRSGSYYTDYEYDWDYEDVECVPVKKVEVVTYEWEKLKE